MKSGLRVLVAGVLLLCAAGCASSDPGFHPVSVGKGPEGKVIAVNRGWNFVVVNLGSEEGATPSSELIIVHHNRQIARVRVSSAEPAMAVADIVSAAHGVQVQPGDLVVFPGK